MPRPEEDHGKAPQAAVNELAATVAGSGETLVAPETVPRRRPLTCLFRDGEIIAGRFRILGFLGAGGMGEVYEALDEDMGGRVALKTIRREAALHRDVLDRLKSEIQLARQITSPHVCRLHEFFRIPASNGRPELGCFNMELLEGRSLAAHVFEHGGLSWSDALPLLLDICEGLKAIHQAGFVHRDLKTGNVMLIERAGRTQAVVMDLGLAQKCVAVSAAAAGGVVSFAGGVVGTPAYMAPEQFQDGSISEATDIYALGVVLYELLSGSPPFQATNPLAAAVERARRLAPLKGNRADAPPYIDLVIARCLEFDPAQRYQSVDEIIAALNPDRNLLRRHPRKAAVIALAAGALCVGLLVLARTPIYKPAANALGWYDKGVLALDEGTYAKASANFQKAVEYDANFALAHARLAEAWSELDFAAKAEHEMLLATSIHTRAKLADLDREYVDAIRQYVTEDYAGAVKTYAGILTKLPENQQAAGFLDLGRAEERAGDMDAALKAYNEAAQRPPESSAPFLRRAILESRANQMDAAERDFAKATELYKASGNYEGLSEVDYQRGYAYSTHSRFDEARRVLEKSLHASEEIFSPQLEIRALTRLAVIDYWQGRDDDAIKLADQAIELAHNRGSDYWAIDARVRMANAYGDESNFGEADRQLKLALSLAQDAKSPRLLALVHSSLAALRDMQHLPDETIVYSQQAFAYYRRAHFDNEAVQCLTLMDRAKLAKGDYAGAAVSGKEALALARKTGNSSVIYLAEELLGSAYLLRQDYPNAFRHLEAALMASRASGGQTEYVAIECADVLWRLGRYPEALEIIGSIPDSASRQQDFANGKAKLMLELNLSRGQVSNAVKAGKQAMDSAPGLGADVELESATLYMEALTEAGDRKSAGAVYEHATESLPKATNPALVAGFHAAAARLLLSNGQTDLAQREALAAFTFFEAAGQWERELFNLGTLSLLAAKTANSNEAHQYSRKALDILAQVAHNWDPKTYKDFSSRLDIQKLVHQLSAMAEGRS